jgi:hypothetical protein
MMTLAEVPPATEIFLDANIFGYDFSGPTLLTPACSALLRHIEEGDITGYTSLIVVVEVLHRLMIIEATAAPQVETRQAVRYLKVHPPRGVSSLDIWWCRKRSAPGRTHPSPDGRGRLGQPGAQDAPGIPYDRCPQARRHEAPSSITHCNE